MSLGRLFWRRFQSHVAQCKTCTGAKTNFERLHRALLAVSFALLAGLAFRAATSTTRVSEVAAVAVVLMSGLCALASKKIQGFIFKTYNFHDYCHAVVK